MRSVKVNQTFPGRKLNLSIFNPQHGASLVEVVVSLGILLIVLVGILGLFLYCSALIEISGGNSDSLSEAQSKMSEILNYSYDFITTDYSATGTPGNKFDLVQRVGKGLITIDSTNSNLLKIEIVVSWRNKNNRVVGEDSNLNGVLDGGEDQNGNGKLDSPITLVTLRARR